MTIRCCVCQRVRDRGQWKDQGDEGKEMVSHTYCPSCLNQSLQAFKEEQSLDEILRVTS